MNASSLAHAALALLAQAVIGLLTGNWWAGAAFGGAFYFGREVAQFEQRRIATYFISRDTMPWYEGFKLFGWSTDGKLDLIVPMLSVLFLALFMHFSPSNYILNLFGL